MGSNFRVLFNFKLTRERLTEEFIVRETYFYLISTGFFPKLIEVSVLSERPRFAIDLRSNVIRYPWYQEIEDSFRGDVLLWDFAQVSDVSLDVFLKRTSWHELSGRREDVVESAHSVNENFVSAHHQHWSKFIKLVSHSSPLNFPGKLSFLFKASDLKFESTGFNY